MKGRVLKLTIPAAFAVHLFAVHAGTAFYSQPAPKASTDHKIVTGPDKSGPPPAPQSTSVDPAKGSSPQQTLAALEPAQRQGPSLQEQMTQRNELLVQRVNDGLTFINVTLVVLGAMGTVIVLFLGISIWNNNRTARAMLEQQFVSFYKEHVKPSVDSDIERLRLAQLSAWEPLLRYSEYTLEAAAFYRSLPAELSDQGARLRQALVYALTCLSPNEDLVVDACHKLTALEASGTLNPVRAVLMRILEQAEDLSQKASSARQELIRVRNLISKEEP